MADLNTIAKKRASEDIEDIKALRKVPAFTRYFGRRIVEELDKRREKVLHGELTKDELWEERQIYLAMREQAKSLEIDEAACRNIIESEGDSG